MRYLALITDYDGTLATAGKVSDAVVAAMQRLRVSGRHVILATGRRLDDLLAICPFIEMFSFVVAENGALVYDPRSRETTVLGEPLPDRFINAVKDANIPIEIGTVILAYAATHSLFERGKKISRLIKSLGQWWLDACARF